MDEISTDNKLKIESDMSIQALRVRSNLYLDLYKKELKAIDQRIKETEGIKTEKSELLIIQLKKMKNKILPIICLLSLVCENDKKDANLNEKSQAIQNV